MSKEKCFRWGIALVLIGTSSLLMPFFLGYNPDWAAYRYGFFFGSTIAISLWGWA